MALLKFIKFAGAVGATLIFAGIIYLELTLTCVQLHNVGACGF